MSWSMGSWESVHESGERCGAGSQDPMDQTGIIRGNRKEKTNPDDDEADQPDPAWP